MYEAIAYCGLVCSKCPAFIATQSKNDEEKARVAQKWNASPWAQRRKLYYTTDDVTCDGCKSMRISQYCRSNCLIRPCAEKRKVNTCAHCNDYGECQQLRNFFIDEPDCKKLLDKIRKNL